MFHFWNCWDWRWNYFSDRPVRSFTLFQSASARTTRTDRLVSPFSHGLWNLLSVSRSPVYPLRVHWWLLIFVASSQPHWAWESNIYQWLFGKVFLYPQDPTSKYYCPSKVSLCLPAYFLLRPSIVEGREFLLTSLFVVSWLCSCSDWVYEGQSGTL